MRGGGTSAGACLHLGQLGRTYGLTIFSCLCTFFLGLAFLLIFFVCLFYYFLVGSGDVSRWRLGEGEEAVEDLGSVELQGVGAGA